VKHASMEVHDSGYRALSFHDPSARESKTDCCGPLNFAQVDLVRSTCAKRYSADHFEAFVILLVCFYFGWLILPLILIKVAFIKIARIVISKVYEEGWLEQKGWLEQLRFGPVPGVVAFGSWHKDGSNTGIHVSVRKQKTCVSSHNLDLTLHNYKHHLAVRNSS